MTDEEKQIIEDYFQDCEYIIGQDEIGGLLDKINQLLKTRQEKMVEELKKNKRDIIVLEDDVLREPKENELTFNSGIDKAIEIIKK